MAQFESLFNHEQMIADAARVDTYYQAINSHIHPGDVVIDLGTGSGILSLFAARRNARQVYAIDHSEFIDIARKIAEHNRADNITFVRTSSRSFTPPVQADVLLYEQLGADLFDENMLDNLFDLKARALKETGKILPGKFELYLEPVSLKTEYRVPFIWEKEVHGIDFSFLQSSSIAQKYKPDSYGSRPIGSSAVEFFLCNPEPILAFDLNAMRSKDELPLRLSGAKQAIRSGQMDGLCLFFRVIFDEATSFDTSPLHTHTHWSNRLFRVEGKPIAEGQAISWSVDMKDITKANTWSVSASVPIRMPDESLMPGR